MLPPMVMLAVAGCGILYIIANIAVFVYVGRKRGWFKNIGAIFAKCKPKPKDKPNKPKKEKKEEKPKEEKPPEENLGDAAAKLKPFFDDQFTPGMDDHAELEVNPVMIYRMDFLKIQAKKEKDAKEKAEGKEKKSGMASSGLARLKFELKANSNDKAAGKQKQIKALELFLQKQEDVD